MLTRTMGTHAFPFMDWDSGSTSTQPWLLAVRRPSITPTCLSTTQRHRGLVREPFGVFERNRQWTEGFRPAPYCAVVWNDRDPPGHAGDDWLWKTNARLCGSGAFAACLDQHLQVTALLQEDLARPDLLNRYAVVYLPDVCHLTSPQLAGVRQFVANGGGLVITYNTSLFAEDGTKQNDFALGDLARIRHVVPDKAVREKMQATLAMGGVWDLYLRAQPDQSVLRGSRAHGLLPAAVYEPVEVLPGGKIAADMVIGSGGESLFPGLVVAEYGKGKVAYLSTAIDAMYRQTRYQEFAHTLADVITYVSPRAPLAEVDAPPGVVTNLMSRGNTHVMHLINWTGSNFEDEQQELYYMPPVENVVVRFRIRSWNVAETSAVVHAIRFHSGGHRRCIDDFAAASGRLSGDRRRIRVMCRSGHHARRYALEKGRSRLTFPTHRILQGFSCRRCRGPIPFMHAGVGGIARDCDPEWCLHRLGTGGDYHQELVHRGFHGHGSRYVPGCRDRRVSAGVGMGARYRSRSLTSIACACSIYLNACSKAGHRYYVSRGDGCGNERRWLQRTIMPQEAFGRPLITVLNAMSLLAVRRVFSCLHLGFRSRVFPPGSPRLRSASSSAVLPDDARRSGADSPHVCDTNSPPCQLPLPCTPRCDHPHGASASCVTLMSRPAMNKFVMFLE